MPHLNLLLQGGILFHCILLMLLCVTCSSLCRYCSLLQQLLVLDGILQLLRKVLGLSQKFDMQERTRAQQLMLSAAKEHTLL